VVIKSQRTASLLSCVMQTMWLLFAACFLTYCVFQMKHRHLPHNTSHRLLVTTCNTYFNINNCISFTEAIHGFNLVFRKKEQKLSYGWLQYILTFLIMCSVFFGARATFLWTIRIRMCSFDLNYWTTLHCPVTEYYNNMDDDYKDPSSQNKFHNLQYIYFYSVCFLLVYTCSLF
jgi:hypothetical protein